MKNKALLAAVQVTVLAVTSLPSLAETQLHPIVTASRFAQSADQTLTAVTVITSDDIKTSQVQTLPELLNERVPGLDFTSAGGKGHQTSLFMRGTNSDHVLVMIDGSIMGSATTGTAAIDLLPLYQIERIEIIRGPRSSLYGSEAIGGVIHIFTKSDAEQKNVSASLGSNNTHDVTAGFGFGNNTSTLNVSVSHFATDGFDITNDSEADDDGHTTNAINVTAKHNLTDTSKLSLHALYAKGDTDFDNDTFDNDSDSVQQVYSLGYDTSLTAAWSTGFSFGQSKDHLVTGRNVRDFFDPTMVNFFTTTFTTKRDQAHWQNEMFLSATGQLAFGIDYLNDKVESTTTYAETERNNEGLYALIQDKFDRHQLQLSARTDDNEAFGRHNTGNIAWSYDINSEMVVSASHGTAFKAPSFNELYFVDLFFNGNPNLEPEESRSSELALTGQQNWGQWDMRAYYTLIENLIVTDASFSSVENADEAEIKGLELELQTSRDGLNGSLSITAIDPTDKSTGLVLQNRAKRTLKLNLSHDVSGYQLGASVLAQSSRFADSANTIELAGYGILNLTLRKKLNKDWMFETRVENLLDKEYSTTVDFFQNTTNNTPISIYAGLAWSH